MIASLGGDPTNLTDQLTALRQTAGLFRLQHTAFLRITGADRTRWLNGMASNNITALAPGEGNYNYFLNAQGKIQGDAYIFRSGDSYFLETIENQRDTLHTLLDHFIIMDDVELARVFDGWRGLLLIGPNAPELVQGIGLPTPEPLHLIESGEAVVIAAYAPSVPRYEIWAPAKAAWQFEAALLAAGAHEVEAEAVDALRILEGTPFFGVDIRDRDLPQETSQDRALHFAKGCYLGQEIVERIRSRGAVHRVFTSFTLEGDAPELPAQLEAGGKPAGELTSAATLPGGTQLALGYARREVLERNTPLLYSGTTGAGGRAIPIPLHSKISY